MPWHAGFFAVALALVVPIPPHAFWSTPQDSSGRFPLAEDERWGLDYTRGNSCENKLILAGKFKQCVLVILTRSNGWTLNKRMSFSGSSATQPFSLTICLAAFLVARPARGKDLGTALGCFPFWRGDDCLKNNTSENHENDNYYYSVVIRQVLIQGRGSLLL